MKFLSDIDSRVDDGNNHVHGMIILKILSCPLNDLSSLLYSIKLLEGDMVSMIHDTINVNFITS
jgi:hypothetical protein